MERCRQIVGDGLKMPSKATESDSIVSVIINLRLDYSEGIVVGRTWIASLLCFGC